MWPTATEEWKRCADKSFIFLQNNKEGTSKESFEVLSTPLATVIQTMDT